MAIVSPPPAGWYSDPLEVEGRRIRWWDGERWSPWFMNLALPPPPARESRRGVGRWRVSSLIVVSLVALAGAIGVFSAMTGGGSAAVATGVVLLVVHVVAANLAVLVQFVHRTRVGSALPPAGGPPPSFAVIEADAQLAQTASIIALSGELLVFSFLPIFLYFTPGAAAFALWCSWTCGRASKAANRLPPKQAVQAQVLAVLAIVGVFACLALLNAMGNAL